MRRFAVCGEVHRSDPGFVHDARVEVMPLDEATVRNLQRLGGRLPDEDAAVVLLSRRELSRMHPSDRAAKQKADMWFAKSVGVWDPQAGEVTT